MATVVYVDVLIFINTVVTYAVLISVERLTKRTAKTWRLIAASLAGSLFALLIFVGIQSFFFSLAIKIASSLTLSAIAFRFISLREYVKNTLACVAVSLLYSGGFILIYQLFKPPNMVLVNDVVYFECNPIVLLICTVIIYGVMIPVQKLFCERIKTTVVPLEFTVEKTDYSCIGKVDTGCNLTEPFSKAPVIIADSSVFTIPEHFAKRVIPYTTVGGSSLLYAVKADRVQINRVTVEKAVYIASAPLGDDHIEAIINSEIVR